VDTALGPCTSGSLDSDDGVYCGSDLGIDKNEWGYVNSTHSFDIPDYATIVNVTICWSGYFEKNTNDNANDKSYVRVGENSTGTWVYTDVDSCIGTACNFNTDMLRCYDVTNIINTPQKAKNVRISLFHIEGDDANMDIFDDYNYVNVTYAITNYSLSVEHNATVSYQGNLQSISVLINFSSTADKDYNITIYNFSSNSWVSCQNISASANVWYGAWCNITTNPTNYISSDNKIRVRLNSTTSQQQATLKEEYVQYYLYTEIAVQRWLEVDWSTSSEINSTKCTQASPCPFTQNSTFVVGAIVTCHTNPSGYDCGSIYGAVRYNNSSSGANTLISTTQGDKPFFIQEASPQNPKSCGTLSDGNNCTLSWVINATGDTLPAIYALDVNFTSTTYNIENDTLDSFVKINPQTYINVVLTNVPICFGSVSGGNIEVAASNGSKTECGTGVYGFPMNVYIESNVNTSLWLRGDSNLVNDSNSISVTNLRCANSSTASEKMGLVLGNYILFQSNIQSGTTVPVYWWLYIPAGTPPGTYTGNITILVNETS